MSRISGHCKAGSYILYYYCTCSNGSSVAYCHILYNADRRSDIYAVTYSGGVKEHTAYCDVLIDIYIISYFG